MRFALTTVLVALALPLAAIAQEGAPIELGEGAIEGVDYVIPEVDRIIFDGIDVKGELVGPSTIHVSETKHKGFNPMIDLRRDFDDAMIRSIDEVK